MNNTNTIHLPEEAKQKLENEIHKALGQRALYGQRYGWGYAIKWFAAWEKEYNKKNPLTH
jgi:hypothetical protein